VPAEAGGVNQKLVAWQVWRTACAARALVSCASNLRAAYALRARVRARRIDSASSDAPSFRRFCVMAAKLQ